MNDAAKEFFDSLPRESETEPEFNIFEEVAPAKDKTQTEQGKEEESAADETQEEQGQEQARKKPLRSERRADKQREWFEQQLREEREARIRLEEQVKASKEAGKKRVDPDINRLLHEVKDPEEATEIFDNLLQKATKAAEERAYERYQEARGQDDSEVNAIHDAIEDNIEAIEDRYGVDLTEDTETRNAFLDFVESIAPEDSDELPNMQNAWKLFQATRKSSTSNVERKQQISSRGMVRSVNAKPEGKDLKPLSFDQLRGDIWDKIVGGR